MTSAPPDTIVAKPRLLFRPDPVLGWSLSPGHGVRVGFRTGEDIVQHVGADGWRHVPGAAEATGKRVAVYGCSFTYGSALADDETFCALLQQARPDLRILNRGIGGHGTVQNLLQLRRDIAAGAVDAAVFAVISDHKYRNVPHPQRMRQFLSPDWDQLGVEHVPVARFGAGGAMRIVYVPLWQPVIEREDFSVFLPDDHMLNTATLAVLQAVRDQARAAGIPLRLVLLDALDPGFNAVVAAHFDDARDVSTPFDADHTFQPRDVHPNPRANRLYAERLTPVLDDLARQAAA